MAKHAIPKEKDRSPSACAAQILGHALMHQGCNDALACNNGDPLHCMPAILSIRIHPWPPIREPVRGATAGRQAGELPGTDAIAAGTLLQNEPLQQPGLQAGR